jgi:hypothetical protein
VCSQTKNLLTHETSQISRSALLHAVEVLFALVGVQPMRSSIRSRVARSRSSIRIDSRLSSALPAIQIPIKRIVTKKKTASQGHTRHQRFISLLSFIMFPFQINANQDGAVVRTTEVVIVTAPSRFAMLIFCFSTGFSCRIRKILIGALSANAVRNLGARMHRTEVVQRDFAPATDDSNLGFHEDVIAGKWQTSRVFIHEK